MLWECSGNTLGGKHGSTLGVLWDVGIACGNTPGASQHSGNSMGVLKERHGKSMGKSEEQHWNNC